MVTMGEDFKDMFGESVKKPSLKDYDVFVQSTGSGKRHLQSGSKVLYVSIMHGVIPILWEINF